MPLMLSSPAILPGGKIPSAYTCACANISPSLTWSGLPQGTGSLVLVVEDPDAPSGTFRHWAAFDLPPAFRPARNSVHSYWPRDVLDLLLAKIMEAKGQPVADMFINGIGNEHPSRLSQRLQSPGDIHPIPEDVLRLGNHVAEVDPDPELDPFLRRGARVPLGHFPLHLDGATDCVHHAGEPVAGVLDHPAAVLGDLRLD